MKELTKKPKKIFNQLMIRLDPLAHHLSAILNHVVPDVMGRSEAFSLKQLFLNESEMNRDHRELALVY